MVNGLHFASAKFGKIWRDGGSLRAKPSVGSGRFSVGISAPSRAFHIHPRVPEQWQAPSLSAPE